MVELMVEVEVDVVLVVVELDFPEVVTTYAPTAATTMITMMTPPITVLEIPALVLWDNRN